MSEKEEEISETEDTENQCGVILGYWDHEKTPSLIQDLEHSVDLVEQKCKNLLEELIYYKKYLEESEKPDVRLTVTKKKSKKSKNCRFFFGSDPDLAYRKNLINLQETQQIFEEKFQEKLFTINKELKTAADKLGLKDSIILFPTDDYLRTLTKQTEREVQKSWNEARENFIKINSRETKTKSDPIIKYNEDNEEFAKITQNELKLYQKLSKLSLAKIRKRMKKLNKRKIIFSKGKKIKFCCKTDTPRFCRGLKTCVPESRKSDFREKKLRKRKKKINVALEKSCSSPGFHEGKNESEIRLVCKALAEVIEKKKKAKDRDLAVECKQSLGTVIRKAMPFTACTSTSRSYNLGLNIQQLLSLSKHGRKSNVKIPQSERTHGSIKEQETSSHSKQIHKDMKRRHTVSWTPDTKPGCFDREEVSHLEHKRKVWVSKRSTSSNFRKIRSGSTGSSSGSFLEFHKSTLSQYTNGQKSMIKSESKTAYAVGSKIMVSGCQRTDVFEMNQGGNFFENASGDGSCNKKCAKLNMEWMRVYSAFLNTYRKYTSLKEKALDNGSTLSDEELKTLENEIDYAIEKYRDFLQFYSKFLHLKDRLKSLKIACESKMFGPVTSFSSNCQKKLYTWKSTNSMAMKKAFKEVQALQDKIRLVND